MTLAELEAIINLDSTISGFVTGDELTAACNNASKETGWAFPVSGDFKELWITHRAKRNCFFVMWTQAARKFKVDQLALGERFKHYSEIVKYMDAEFAKAIEDNPAEFSGVEAYKMFGTIAGTGLVNDITGNDITDYSA